MPYFKPLTPSVIRRDSPHSRLSGLASLRRAAMTGLVGLALSVLPAAAFAGADLTSPLRHWVQRPAQTPHPAVVQVVVQLGGATANGSGTLIYTDDQYGYVLTNWHVVREAKGMIAVVFPDGFQSFARVLNTDRDWDLALLLIWRPHVSPMAVAGRVPQPGEPITIAGYGSGDYRAARGVAVEYAAPNAYLPYELVDISVPARQGDSGGPMVNDSGELAGVLFGTGHGRTTGSHVGRVRTFLDTTFRELTAASSSQSRLRPERSLATQSTSGLDSEIPRRAARDAIATAPPISPHALLPPSQGVDPSDRVESGTQPVRQTSSPTEIRPDPGFDKRRTVEPAPAWRTASRDSRQPLTSLDIPAQSSPSIRPQRNAPIQNVSSEMTVMTLDDLLGRSLWDKGKSLFAVVGLLAILNQIFRRQEK